MDCEAAGSILRKVVCSSALWVGSVREGGCDDFYLLLMEFESMS